MPKLWKKTGNAKDNSDLVEVDQSNLSITGRTVIYFPGRDQSDGNPSELSKGIHFVNKLFSDLETPPQVYIHSHSDMYSKTAGVKTLTSLFRVAAYSHLPGFSTKSIKKLAQGVVMPLVTDAEGKPLPLDEAAKNLRNLTFLGYCLGSIAAQEVYNASAKLMHEAGYSKEDTQKLLREIVLVSFATFSRPEKESNRYTTLAFINNDDLFINAKNMVVMPVTSLVSMGVKLATLTGSEQRLNIDPLSDTSIVISAAAREGMLDSIPLLPNKKKEIIDNVTLPNWKPLDFNHEAKAYINMADQSNQFARMVKNALHNAVTRTSLVRPIDLLNEPEGVTTPGYDKKITKGLFEKGNRSYWKTLYRKISL